MIICPILSCAAYILILFGASNYCLDLWVWIAMTSFQFGSILLLEDIPIKCINLAVAVMYRCT